MNNNSEDFDEEDIDSLKDKYLVFTLSNEFYCIEINYVTEITGFQKITEVPDSAYFIKGIINLRGKILPVIDVRLRFNFEPKEYTDRTCIIICTYNDVNVGLIVDSVSEVAVILPDQIEPPPSTNKINKSHFLTGMGKTSDGVKMIIKLKSLLDQEDFETISNKLSLEA